MDGSNQLAAAHLGWVSSLVLRNSRLGKALIGSDWYGELFAAGCVGLAEAMTFFDPDKGALTTLSKRFIENAIQRCIGSHTAGGNNAYDARLILTRAFKDLKKRTGKDPSANEALEHAADLDDPRLAALHLFRLRSAHQAHYTPRKVAGVHAAWVDPPQEIQSGRHMLIRSLKRVLDSIARVNPSARRKVEAFRLYHQHGMEYRQVGAELNCSHEYARQMVLEIERRVKRRLEGP